MDLVNLTVVAEKLEKSIFDLSGLYALIEVLYVNSCVRSVQLLLLNAFDLEDQSWRGHVRNRHTHTRWNHSSRRQKWHALRRYWEARRDHTGRHHSHRRLSNLGNILFHWCGHAHLDGQLRLLVLRHLHNIVL